MISDQEICREFMKRALDLTSEELSEIVYSLGERVLHFEVMKRKSPSVYGGGAKEVHSVCSSALSKLRLKM